MDQDAGEWQSLQRRGLVRVVSGPVGTEIKWATFSPCLASLFFISDWLSDLPAPYMLRYFLAGWFEEEFRAPEEAHDRIIDIIARSDIHLMRRVFVQQGDPARNGMPASLRCAWGGRDEALDRSVDCRYDEAVGQFRVIRVGRQSTIAKLWGTEPSTYPCANGGIYDRAVGAAYWDVVQTGAPRYDHVYAAMRMPAGELVWIPYQRVILPGEWQRGTRAVRVLTEIAKVDISII
ncbi:MAG: hypothetical protein FJX63_01115 [Alphaproteobacteria bacterium]|nr:hypothetical protein [Alphaproteobacteria bacterium]